MCVVSDTHFTPGVSPVSSVGSKTLKMFWLKKEFGRKAIYLMLEDTMEKGNHKEKSKTVSHVSINI